KRRSSTNGLVYLWRVRSSLDRPSLGLSGRLELDLSERRTSYCQSREMCDQCCRDLLVADGPKTKLAALGHDPCLDARALTSQRPDVRTLRNAVFALSIHFPCRSLSLGGSALAGLYLARRSTPLGEHPRAVYPRACIPDLRPDRCGSRSRRVREVKA